MTDNNVVAFRAASRALAEEAGLPIIMPTGAFVSDARCAWAVERVEAHQVAAQEPRHDPGWFHASSLGRDDAQLLREFAGSAGDRHSAGTLRIFDNGHNRDEAWKRYWRDAGMSIFPWSEDKEEREEMRRIRLWPLRLTGRCDDVIRNSEDEEPCVVEFKTINQFNFNALREPKPDHLQQIHCYMRGLNISQGIVLYEDKNTQALKAFAVDFDLDLWLGIETRLKRLLGEATVGIKALSTPEGRKRAAALEV